MVLLACENYGWPSESRLRSPKQYLPVLGGKLAQNEFIPFYAVPCQFGENPEAVFATLRTTTNGCLHECQPPPIASLEIQAGNRSLSHGAHGRKSANVEGRPGIKTAVGCRKLHKSSYLVGRGRFAHGLAPGRVTPDNSRAQRV